MKNETISTLLIEDNAGHMRLLEQLLAQSEPMHFALHTVGSLAAGLARLRLESFPLVILDLSLPDSSGMETFIRTVEAVGDAALVVLSGTQDAEVAAQTVHLGAQDFLVKGRFDNPLLLRALHYSVERKRAQIQLQRANAELERRVTERTAALLESNTRLQREIAERKKAEESVLISNRQLADALKRIEATQEQVIRRERMHALGRMAHGMAHDFNNALAPILGFSELLLINPAVLADPPKLRSYLEMIHAAARESERVTSRLREFYRYRDEGEIFTAIAINDLVLQAISVTQPRWKDQALAAGVTIDIRTEMSHAPTLRGNEQELREMLVNLIFNAVDAIVKRGIITVRTQVRGHALAITVADDGAGMTEEVRSRCLEPFFSTKDSDASGLGLGSVYGIVRRHEGDIDIQSEAGRGTSVTITLPLDKLPRPPEPPSAARPAGESLRILVVEDEPLVREVLSVYLEEDRHHVTLAANGREGYEKFQAGEFDVVLTDRAMPEMSGDELALAIRKLKPRQPVVLLTGFGDLMARTGEKPPGVDIVVSKPFTLAALRNALAMASAKS